MQPACDALPLVVVQVGLKRFARFDQRIDGVGKYDTSNIFIFNGIAYVADGVLHVRNEGVDDLNLFFARYYGCVANDGIKITFVA